jgi:hypothetical protein
MGILRDGVVKTRKDHKCYGCCNTIKKGETVYSQTNVYDGHIYTLYYCNICRDWCQECTDCIDVEDAHEGFIGECIKEKSKTIDNENVGVLGDRGYCE